MGKEEKKGERKGGKGKIGREGKRAYLSGRKCFMTCFSPSHFLWANPVSLVQLKPERERSLLMWLKQVVP